MFVPLTWIEQFRQPQIRLAHASRSPRLQATWATRAAILTVAKNKVFVMWVTCIRNELAAIQEEAVRRRLQEAIHLERICDLVTGRRYAVQAIEIWRDGGWRFFLHTRPESDWPYPFPAEFFHVDESDIPSNWRIRTESVEGRYVIKRITFADWANNDAFYEQLVDGDAMSAEKYRRNFRT